MLIEKQKGLFNTCLDAVVHFADDPDCLVWKGLLDDLVAGLGALVDAVAQEERVGHLDEDVVHAVHVHVLDAPIIIIQLLMIIIRVVDELSSRNY